MKKLFSFFLIFLLNPVAWAQDLKIPEFHSVNFGFATGWELLFYGSLIIFVTLSFSLYMSWNIKNLRSHRTMLGVAETIYRTCKVYLIKQAKFLFLLFLIVMVIISVYLLKIPYTKASILEALTYVLGFALLGMMGSYGVAWYGIRLNTLANSRTTFAALRGDPWQVVNIPLQSGMSAGLFLISLELIIMVFILLFVPRELSSVSLLGFAVGESLCASVLRLAGGIFTKIADIGADLMKNIFNVKEDDPRNPAVIADCAGDNGGDEVGPTSDYFESYGVTGVALITFFILSIVDIMTQGKLIVWIFAMRFVMDVFSGISYFVNQYISRKKYANNSKEFDFEEPLTRLLRLSAFNCILASFIVSYFLLAHLGHGYWWKLASIVTCGTLGALILPELTKFFTSTRSKHVKEIVKSSREGGASLTVLSGIVAGKMSAYWQGMSILFIMALAYYIGITSGLENIIPNIGIGSSGLVAFGILCMGPVNIAVDGFGPVADNSQSIFELSQIEKIDGISEEIEREFGFTPDFSKAKRLLEQNDACGNTFKAAVKPVLIGTAVAGSTTMIFSIMLILRKVGMLNLSLTEAPVIFGLIAGGAFMFWFAGASIQAVTTGAYRATKFVRKNFNFCLEKAKVEDSEKVVEICTTYAQKGSVNIFIVLISTTIGSAFTDPNFFISYLISISIFGLFLAIYMANAGGAWDNAKK